MADVLTVQNKTILEALQNHEDGEVAYCEEEQTYMIYKDNQWIPVEAQMDSDGLKLNLYDLNKQIIDQLPDFDEVGIKDFTDAINAWIKPDVNYYLLYGREINYFTLFKKANVEEKFSDILIECLNQLGPIKTYSIPDETAIEIWVKYEDNVTCLYLFNYDDGVVEYNG